MKLAKALTPIDADSGPVTDSVYGSSRDVSVPDIKLHKDLRRNERLKMDGLKFLSRLPEKAIPVAFFDPQYRGVLDKLNYGNEGKKRSRARASLRQMNEDTIHRFIQGIDRALIPSGHLFLWMDKFHLCAGFLHWLEGTKFEVVDMLTWHKNKIGMGYRTRRISEHLVVLQKRPKRAKGVWRSHNIADVWRGEANRNGHPHAKPAELQADLIECVSNPGDIVIDPAAGSFSVLDACRASDRTFLGCDING